MKISYFGIQVVISTVLGAFAYVFYHINCIPAAGFLGPLSVLVGISAFCNGQWQNNIRKRYAWNIVFSILIYIPIGVILLDGFLSLVQVPLADKTLNIIPETRIAVGTSMMELGKLFASTPEFVQLNGNVKWSYLFLVVHLIWCGYKIWSSYGTRFMIASASIVGVMICYICFRPDFQRSLLQWHALWVVAMLIPFLATWYLFKHPEVA